MADPTDTAEAALERLRSILARWPRPVAGQGVRADAVLAGLAPLAPIAEMVLRLKPGYGKGYYQGAGYLSGSSRITDADLALARAVVQDLTIVLPAAGERPLTRDLYSQIKTHAYKLLGLATDLDVTQGNLAKLGTAPGAAWDTWVSLAKVEPVVQVGAGSVNTDIMDRDIAKLVAKLTKAGALPDSVDQGDGKLFIGYNKGHGDLAAKARKVLPPSITFKLAWGPVVTPVVVQSGDDPPRAATDVGAAVKAVDSPIAQKADAAIARVLRFTRAFPRPTATQRVTVLSAATALAPLRSLAAKIFAMPVGTKKGTIAGSGSLEVLARVFSPLYNIAEAIAGKPQPATGYLTGPLITEDDRATARFILNTLDATLPLYTSPLLDPADYEAIRKEAHQLMLIGTDLDIDTEIADKVTLAWASLKESVKELVQQAQKGADEGWDLLKIGLVVSMVAGGVYVVKTVFGR